MDNSCGAKPGACANAIGIEIARSRANLALSQRLPQASCDWRDNIKSVYAAFH